MLELFSKICFFLLVYLQLIKAESTISREDSTVDSSLVDKKIDFQRFDLLPNTTVCGKSSHLDQFPWMALLEYETPQGNRDFKCGGSLINKRYILTIAACLKDAKLRGYKILGVRLGEFNIGTDPDCIKTVRGVQCAPSPLNLEIEKEIVHEDYVPDQENKQHDIGLLRLKEEVEFTETVRPLCLPTTPEHQRITYVGKTLILAGWESKIWKNGSTKLKLRVSVPDQETCRSKYNRLKVNLGDGQFCAGGERGRGTCRGDGGNSLMVPDIDENAKVYWYAVGMVSFGPSLCGRAAWPSVYTNISTYMPWILDKLKA